MKTLGDILIENELISAKDLEEISLIQKRSNLPIYQILQKKNVVKESDLLWSLSVLYDIALVDKIEFEPNDLFSELIPEKFIQKSKLVPYRKKGKKIFVATSDPSRMHLMDDVRRFLREYEVEFVASPETEILKIIHENFDSTAKQADQFLDDIGDLSELEELEDTIDMSDDAPIIRMVNIILSQSINERASDIHIEPYEKTLIVRYRIDGVLHNVLSPPKSYHAGLVSRIKIMSSLNIAEHRLPQDGRINVRIAGKEIDVRVSTIPCQYGERVVMRILNKTDQKYSIESLGLPEETLTNLKKVINKPNGIFLVTGPTGSGKTTTLYSALTELNTEDRNIITCEDPIEYQIEGISQMQMQEKIGLTFAIGLRAILRQDPDVVMIGEIRDEETARIAIQASLTGHFVFATLHTNDAASSVTRLMDMGIESYLISSSLAGVMAQRLVRLLCDKCKKSYEPTLSETELIYSFYPELKDYTIYQPNGCDLCMNTGYKGRVGIYELLLVNEGIKSAILRNLSTSEINQIALSNSNFIDMKKYGIAKVLNGYTTIEEVLRVC